MQTLERARQTEFLGKEFLTWLWFKSETNDGSFDLGELGTVEHRIDGRITLQSDGDNGAETITCVGQSPCPREARFALTEKKMVTQTTLTLSSGDNECTFSFDSCWMNFKSLKPPKTMRDWADDPEGLFYERAFLIEQPARVIDMLFSTFTRLRTSTEWHTQELPALIEWVREGA